jgi:toxin YoeB
VIDFRFTQRGWEDYCSWVGDRKLLARVNRLIDEASKNPAEGIGKPERLSGDLAGCWSRRIDHEHRLVYTFVEGDLVILMTRYHYNSRICSRWREVAVIMREATEHDH